MLQNKLFELANLFIRVMIFEKAGDESDYDGHVHSYDHAHFLSCGVMDVTVNGEVTRYTAPAMIWIKAGVGHKQTAAADNTIGLCIHALRSKDGSGEPVDAALIPRGVNPWDFGELPVIPADADPLSFAEYLAWRQQSGQKAAVDDHR
jgi:quercetin dioxygenase-like cupin family protein